MLTVPAIKRETFAMAKAIGMDVEGFKVRSMNFDGSPALAVAPVGIKPKGDGFDAERWELVKKYIRDLNTDETRKQFGRIFLTDSSL